MPIKVVIVANRQVVDSHRNARCASVQLELVLDADLAGDPSQVREHIRQLFGLANAALAEQLDNGGDDTPPPAPAQIEIARPALRVVRHPRSNGVRLATPPQVKALHAIT